MIITCDRCGFKTENVFFTKHKKCGGNFCFNCIYLFSDGCEEVEKAKMEFLLALALNTPPLKLKDLKAKLKKEREKKSSSKEKH